MTVIAIVVLCHRTSFQKGWSSTGVEVCTESSGFWLLIGENEVRAMCMNYAFNCGFDSAPRLKDPYRKHKCCNVFWKYFICDGHYLVSGSCLCVIDFSAVTGSDIWHKWSVLYYTGLFCLMSSAVLLLISKRRRIVVGEELNDDDLLSCFKCKTYNLHSGGDRFCEYTSSYVTN